MSQKSLSAWTLRVRILYSATKNPKKPLTETVANPTLKNVNKREGRIVVYRSYFQKLLRYPKSPRDQMCIELACLEGLRSGEISEQRAEWFDLGNGDLKILDSKKHEMFTLPLDPKVAQTFIEMNVSEGYLITGRKHTGKGLETETIERIFTDYSLRANGFPMNPRLGRAYLAVMEHFVLRKPTGYIQWLLRHDSLLSTEHYLSKIVDYEDMRAMFYEGKSCMFPEGVEVKTQ